MRPAAIYQKEENNGEYIEFCVFFILYVFVACLPLFDFFDRSVYTIYGGADNLDLSTKIHILFNHSVPVTNTFLVVPSFLFFLSMAFSVVVSIFSVVFMIKTLFSEWFSKSDFIALLFIFICSTAPGLFYYNLYTKGEKQYNILREEQCKTEMHKYYEKGFSGILEFNSEHQCANEKYFMQTRIKINKELKIVEYKKLAGETAEFSPKSIQEISEDFYLKGTMQ